MALFLLAYIGGVLTILSPCILPILPFVFARADKPFLSNGLPILIGMGLTFTIIATLAAVGGAWAVTANEYGRYIALALLFIFGLTLLFPSLAERLTRPLVELGNKLSSSADSSASSSVGPSLLLGVATGLLWAPCAGPILGLVLTGAALNGANVSTAFLLIAYAAGAATSLAIALLAGGTVFQAMKRSIGAGEWVRRGLGAAVIVAVLAITFGFDRGALTRLSLTTTSSLEQRLLDRFGGKSGTQTAQIEETKSGGGSELADEGPMPSFDGATTWLNSAPLTAEQLKGKVVLVDFWTYSCINCLRAIPYVRAWAEKYKDDGLVVVGVHTPEFAFEKIPANVKTAVSDLGITYPVALDNDYAIWRSFKNEYWPAHYFIDAKGRIRHHHFGEGGYDKSEQVIRQLLSEAGKSPVASTAAVSAKGIELASKGGVQSPETYVGYARAENFVSPGGAAKDRPNTYTSGAEPKLNQWALAGNWTIGAEKATLNEKVGTIVFRFHARDLHLVLGPGPDGKQVKFSVSIDGKPPGPDHGVDVGEDGQGAVTTERLYQLVRQAGDAAERTFEIKFLDPGVQAFAFTFG